MTTFPGEIDDAQSLLRGLKQLFTSHEPGCENAEALRNVRHLCQAAKRLVCDGNCHAQLRQVERYARFFFSSEAHRQWARDTGFGGVRLRGLALQLLNALELRLSQSDAQPLPEGVQVQPHLTAEAGQV